MVDKSYWPKGENSTNPSQVRASRSGSGWIVRESPELMERISKMYLAEKAANPKISGNEISLRISRELAKDGIKVGYDLIRRLEKNGKLFMFPEAARKADGKILESLDRVISEFEEVYLGLKEKFKEWRDDPEAKGEWLTTAKLLLDALETSLKKQGEFRDSLNLTQNNYQINFNVQAEMVNFLKDKNVEIEGDTIKFRSPEFIDILKRNIQPKEEKEIPVAA